MWQGSLSFDKELSSLDDAAYLFLPRAFDLVAVLFDVLIMIDHRKRMISFDRGRLWRYVDCCLLWRPFLGHDFFRHDFFRHDFSFTLSPVNLRFQTTPMVAK